MVGSRKPNRHPLTVPNPSPKAQPDLVCTAPSDNQTKLIKIPLCLFAYKTHSEHGCQSI